jgi:spermidine/putrescine transport system substrate-binding protein
MHPARRRAISRRDFLRRGAGTAVALPSLSALLEACSKPGQGGPVASGSSAEDLLAHPARPDHPVTLPTFEEPIAPDTPIERGATLKIYNWDYYIDPHLARDGFEHRFAKYDVKVDITWFYDINPAVAKLTSGQVQADVFFPDPSELTRLVLAKQLKPLQHQLIPNLATNYWPEFQNPFYDQGWRYSVPYTVYTTGIAYRRDHVPDDEVGGRDNPYEVLWDPKWKGEVTIYDDYRETIGMALLKNGITDVNTTTPDHISAAKEDLLKLISATDAALTINGVYVKMAHDQYWVGSSWSGDIVDAFLYYAPPGTPDSVWGYWYPPDGGGMIGNDLMVIPTSGQNPRLAHEFLNYMLEMKNSYLNFTKYNGYQTPMNSINPSELVGKVYPRSLAAAVVQPKYFDKGHFLLELTPQGNALWNSAWDEIKAGA